MRQVLPQRRAAETFDLRFWNQLFTVTVGFYADGTPGEVFVGVDKTGNDIESIARDAGVLLSLTLEVCVRRPRARRATFMGPASAISPETIRHAVTRGGSEEPASILGAIVDALHAAAGACQ